MTIPFSHLLDGILLLDIVAWVSFSFVVMLTFWLSRWCRRVPPKKEEPFVLERASHYSPDAIDPTAEWDAIFIGTGPGACTCANLLSQMGQKVLMLEQHPDSTGGGTHSFRIENCEWDTGLHYSSKAISERTCRPGTIMDYMTRGTQKFHQFPEPYDEIVFPDHKSYNYMNGKTKTIDTLMKECGYGEIEETPEVIDDILLHGHYDESEVMKERVTVFMNLYEDIHRGFVALGLLRVLPKWLHWFVKSRVEELRKLATLTVRDVLYAVLNLGYTKDLLLHHPCPHAPTGVDPNSKRQRLKAVLSHPIGDYGTQPKVASLAAHGVTAEHYIDGGSYTVGPTQNISIRLTSVISSCGGQVLVGATVRGIIIENGKAVGVRVSKTTDIEHLGIYEAPQTTIRAKNIVCGTSTYNLYKKLLPQDLPAVQQFNDPTQRTMRQSNGHLFVFCKLAGTPNELQLPDHNIWYFNGSDLDDAFDKFYEDPYHHRPPVLYIGFPCTKDRTWTKRFPRTSNCILISDGLYKWFEQWSGMLPTHRGKEYDDLKEALTSKLLDILYEFVPQVKGKVEYVHFATPLTEESFLGSYRGGAYDTLCTPEMFHPMNEKWITNPKTLVPNLYVASSSAFFPGLTGSMYGGCLCACNILGTYGTFALGYRIIKHLAKCLQEENPKMSRLQAYKLAIKKFVNE